MMQGSQEIKLKKFHSLFNELVSKIARLRSRLIGCGYSIKEVIDIIFYEFLHLPQIDWSNLKQTNSFYELKSNYKVDTASAEIMTRLQKIVPNLHTREVCQYMLAVLEINASDFGFNLVESSSDSNDSNSNRNKLIIGRPKNRRIKRNKKREETQQKIKKTIQSQIIMMKKPHYDQQYLENKAVQQQVQQFFKQRPMPNLLPFVDDQVEKQMKNIPQSSDSEHE